MSIFRVPSPTTSAHSLQSSCSSLEFKSTSSFPLTSNPTNTVANKKMSQNEQSTLISLTSEELLQLRNLLGSQNRSMPERRMPKAPPTSEKKNPSKWPEWDGTKENYNTYIDQLAVKIDVDWEILGGHKAVCNDMMNTIPTKRRNRVAAWFATGGPNGDWDYELFIEHFNENFEDKTSAREAGQKLTRMKQGMHQGFASFLNDFEYMLAQADGLRWEGRVKVNALSSGLNARLSDYLISFPHSDDNYSLFVKQVKSIAGKLEAKDDYVPRHGPKYTKTWFIDRVGNVLHNSESDRGKTVRSALEPAQTQLDADGDTTMSGINGISMSTLTTIINAISQQSQSQPPTDKVKPPAPWRTQQEFAELRREGKCTRCAKKGHFFKKCPSFTWAKRPSGINAVSLESTNIQQSSVSAYEENDFSEKE